MQLEDILKKEKAFTWSEEEDEDGGDGSTERVSDNKEIK